MKRRHHFCTHPAIFAFTVLCLVYSSSPGEDRKFTAKDGRTLSGELLSVDGAAVTIRRSDGATFTLQAETFSLEDQQYFKAFKPAGLNGRDMASPEKQQAEKVTASQIRTYPFTSTAGDERLDSKDRDMFDELRVSTSERIRIYGKKEKDSGTIDGRVVYHMGKVAIFPPGNRSGALNTPLESSTDVRRYFATLETGTKLVTKELELSADSDHAWTLSEEGENTVLKVSQGNNDWAVLTAPTKAVTGAGFAATVRWIDNEADLRVTFDDPED